MNWREFEELIGELLTVDGYQVSVTQPTRDGGLDVIAVKQDPTIGLIRSVWQAKRYGPARRVRLAQVRDFAAVVSRENATKGVIVTTSNLTRDAIDWVRRDLYRLDYKDGEDVAAWIRRAIPK